MTDEQIKHMITGIDLPEYALEFAKEHDIEIATAGDGVFLYSQPLESKSVAFYPEGETFTLAEGVNMALAQSP